MKKLSIKAKVTIVICACLFLVLGAMSTINSHLQSSTIGEMCTETGRNLSWTITQQLEQIMIHGENETLQPLTEEIVSKGLLEEITVVDADLKVRRSSDKSLVDKPAADPMWKALFESLSDTVFNTEVDGVPVKVTYHVLENKPKRLLNDFSQHNILVTEVFQFLKTLFTLLMRNGWMFLRGVFIMNSISQFNMFCLYVTVSKTVKFEYINTLVGNSLWSFSIKQLTKISVAHPLAIIKILGLLIF